MTNSLLQPFNSFGAPLQQCVLPLVAKIDNELFPVGTGFVINADGLFVTAAHVLTEAHSKAVRRQNLNGQYYNHYEFYAIYVSDEPLPEKDATVGGLLPIDRIWAPNDLDIGFGWLRLPRRVSDNTLLPLYPVRIRPAIPKIGSQITAIGYYQMAGSLENSDTSVIKYAMETAISTGTIEAIYPEYRDKGMLSFPCFHSNAKFNHGMSGGPIFDEQGNVLGVVCSGLNSSEEACEFISYGSLIYPILGCQIDIAKQPEAQSETTLLYDLALEGHIITDDSLQHIQVISNSNGSRTISIQTA